MMRKLFVLMLLLDILACPIRCGLCSADEVGDGAHSAACACCDGPSAGTCGITHDDPPCGDAPCSCQNSVCDGAILLGGVPISRPAPSYRWIGLAWMDGAGPPVMQRRIEVSTEVSGTLGGIDARIAYQSWLI